MNKTTVSGSPYAIGVQYGTIFKEKIADNLRILVKRIGYGAPPVMDAPMVSWIEEQESIIAKAWPWMIEEMRGTAEGAAQTYADILQLNLRIWQYAYLKASGNHTDSACSSLVITENNRTIANVGALDDPSLYYCGVVHVVPDTGLPFLTFPIAGTCWGNRGVNAAGLAIGVSSMLVPGLRRNPGTIGSDFALRALLQTCKTVADVRAFCSTHSFAVNLVCTDASGEVLCAHQTTAGLFELSTVAPYAVTNHIVDDSIICELVSLGAQLLQESPSTRLRRGRLLAFAAANNAKISGEAVRAFVAQRNAHDKSMTCPADNVVLTYCNSI